MFQYRNWQNAVTFVAMLCLASQTLAETAADVRKSVQSAYTNENASMMRKDANSVFAAYAPDFSQTSLKGETLTLIQLKQMVPSVFASAKQIKDKTTVQKIALQGDKATVTVKRHSEIVALSPRKKAIKMAVDAVTEDLWVKTAQGWRLKRQKSLKEKQTMNGRPLPQ